MLSTVMLPHAQDAMPLVAPLGALAVSCQLSATVPQSWHLLRKGFSFTFFAMAPSPPVAVDLLASPPSDATHRDPLRGIACLGQPFGGYTDQEVLRQGGIIRFDSEATSIECQGGL